MPAQKQSFGTMVKKVIDRNAVVKPSYGIVYSIDCDRIDVRIGTSSTVLRHVEVLGSIDSLRIGQQVYLRWEKGRPVAVMAQDTYTDSITPRTVVQPDGTTIEYSVSGLRVKPQGLGLEHLNFTPSQQGHTHGDDPFTASGWKVDDDGVIWQYRTFINPMGQIQLGINENIIKLDSADDEYRLWAGDPDPLLANFALGVDGSVRLTAGTIGGVDINETDVTADTMILTGSGVYLDGIQFVGGSSPSEGDVFTISGSTAVWEPPTTPEAPRITALFSVSGSAALIDPIPLRIYNKSGAEKTIVEVFLAVNEAPTGDDLIVDISVNGVTIFTTPSNRPKILDGQDTGTSTTIEAPSFPDGEYIQASVMQVGSSSAGADLTIHAIYQ